MTQMRTAYNLVILLVMLIILGSWYYFRGCIYCSAYNV